MSEPLLPRHEDLLEVCTAAAPEPAETTLRLEVLKRDVITMARHEPLRLADLAWGLEHCRSLEARKVKAALQLTALRAVQMEEADRAMRWWRRTAGLLLVVVAALAWLVVR